MSHKEDLLTGRGIAQALRDRDITVEKEGSYNWVEDNKGGRVYIPDTARTLPKPTRENIIGKLVKAGLLILVPVCLIISAIANVLR